MKTRKYQQGQSIRPTINLSLLAPNGEIMAQHASNIGYLANREKEAYEADMSQPYYQIHEKPSFEQWKQQNQAVQQNQGTVSPAEKVSAPVNVVNQYVRQFKHDMANGKVPKGKYTLPAAALGAMGLAGFTVAPVSTVAATIGGTVGSKAVNSGMKFVTGKSWADWVSNKTGLDSEAAEITNPGMWLGGYWVPKYGTNVAKRGIETAMRTSPTQNGLQSVLYDTKQMIKNKDFQRMKAIGKYIFSGRTTGKKGYYNSLRVGNPEENYYGGFDWIPENLRGKNDVIDAFLYGKEIDPGFGLYRKAIGKDFGIHTDYISKYYPWKSKNIQIYSTSKNDPLSDKIKLNGTRGVDSEIETTANVGYDAAGHLKSLGTDAAGNHYTMEQDIWKFNPRQYMDKWINNKAITLPMPLWKKALVWGGLEAVNRAGTPVIVKTPWQAVETFSTKPTLHGDLSLPPSEIAVDMVNFLKKVDLSNITKPIK